MAATLTTKSARTAARQAARKSATAAQEAIAQRTGCNAEDLAVFFSAGERSESVDAWLAGRMAALREQADEGRAEHRRAAGAALAAMRGRGETVREIARMAGIGEKSARELMRLVKAAPAGLAGAASGDAEQTARNGVGRSTADVLEPTQTPSGQAAPAARQT